MTPFDVVIYTSLTVIVFVVVFLGYYFFRTKAMLKKTNQRAVELEKELKPGMRVLCAGGIIATYQSKNADGSIAKVKLSDGSVVEVAFYSIGNIIV